MSIGFHDFYRHSIDLGMMKMLELEQGCLLLAKEGLEDPNFSDTVVWIGQYAKEGSYGLILNRCAKMPMREIFDSVALDTERVVHIGGPVEESELQVVHIPDENSEGVLGALSIQKGIYLGGQWDELEDMLQLSEAELHLFLGYAGWGAGQLEEEVRFGGWDIAKPPKLDWWKQGVPPWANGAQKFKKFLSEHHKGYLISE